MSVYSGPEIVNDGLVFAYDMSNPQKSWRGAPTTNLATTQTLVNHSLVTLPTFSDAPEKGVGWKKAIVTATSSNFRMLRMDAFNVLANSTTTYSIEFECSSPEVYLNIDGTGFGGGAWTKIGPTRYSRTVTTATAGQAYLFVCSNNLSANVNYIIYYKEHQIENNSFATPFVNGTRSNTQSIFDLTNNNTVTATSLTYDSNNTFSFVRANSNYINISANTNTRFQNSYQTWSGWVNIASIGPNGYSELWNNGGNTGMTIQWTASLVQFFIYNGAYLPYPVSVTNALNTWMNITCVIDNVARVMILYKNGTLVGTSPQWAAYTPPSGSVHIGGNFATGNGGDFTQGSIPSVQLYNRALTAAEVQQNFNATRGRYGI